MKRSKTKPKHIRQEDWDAVESPPLTAAQLKQMRPLREVMPDLAEAYRRTRGRPKVAVPKRQVSLRLDADVIETFKAGGPGWQSRINEVLSNWAKRRKRAA